MPPSTTQGRRRWHGSPTHNEALLRPLEAHAKTLGARTAREVRVGTGRTAGRVDLLIENDAVRLVVEAELSAKRVLNDVKKARDLDANGLLILVPNRRVAQTIRRRLPRAQRETDAKTPRVFVLSPGQAIQRLSTILDLMTRSVSHASSSQQTSGRSEEPPLD